MSCRDRGLGSGLILIARPQGTAFSGEVILNRCDTWWLKCVGEGARHHLYPVHVSGCLLSTPSLAAALYLLVSRFVAGQYDQVRRSFSRFLVFLRG